MSIMHVFPTTLAVTPDVFFDPTSYTVNEDVGVATLTIRTNVLGGPPNGAVEFYTEGGTATGEPNACTHMFSKQ